MSKKRTSPESSNDEQKNEGSDSAFQQDDNAKRARLAPLHDTTLQDLPIELIECILIKAVAMEVKDMKLAKSVWNERADLVISRLRTVCSQWNSILSTNVYRSQLQIMLDDYAMKMVHMEILHQYPIILHPKSFFIIGITTLADYVYILCKSFFKNGWFAINVYHRDEMTVVEDVIPLPGMNPPSIAACSVSNCLYSLIRGKGDNISVLRITKTDDHQFNISPLICDILLPRHTFSVTFNGGLILSEFRNKEQRAVISTYDANGSLQHEIRLSGGVAHFQEVILRANENLVLVSASDSGHTLLREISTNGTILRQYQSAIELTCKPGVVEADMYGRIIIAHHINRMELLDSEFNLLEFHGPPENNTKCDYFRKMYFDRDTSEIVAIVNDCNRFLFTFRLREE